MNVKWLFHPSRRYAADLSLLAVGALPEADRARLERHLDQCPACRARLAELQTLSDRLAQDGRDLPSIEPPLSLRRRWMTEVRQTMPSSSQPVVLWIPIWLTGRRLAWGGIAAIWMLSLFFRFSAPDVSRPAIAAAPPPSLRQILLVFRSEPRMTSYPIPTETRPAAKPSTPDTAPPRSEGPGTHSTASHSLI
jgi:hypothetical protein